MLFWHGHSHPSSRKVLRPSSPENPDGFFLEAHVKLSTVDFACERHLCLRPWLTRQTLVETIARAQAAAARAVNILTHPR
jgi:heterodisulfide reductase subunit A